MDANTNTNNPNANDTERLRPNTTFNSITSQQKWTSAGLLGAIGFAFVLSNRIPAPYVLTATIGFGAGTSLAVGFYRVAELFKNGRPESNQFGKGGMAGIALFCSLMSFNVIPTVITELPQTVMFKDVNTSLLLPLMIISGLVGFFQNRANTLEGLVDENQRHVPTS